ncbi:hypothetical protein C8R48DRAFT_776009 [Suillus tomentosus]|nr:hypothetical protein C8R48DRAFT_776009 [Suillus tomentosus]
MLKLLAHTPYGLFQLIPKPMSVIYSMRDISRMVLSTPFESDHFAERNAARRAARHRLAKLLVDPAIHSPDESTAEDTDNDPEFPTVRKFAEKVDIIKQWQHEMSPEMQQRSACAVCAHSVCIKQLKTVSSSKLYDRAILYPKGLCDRWALADLRLCRQCHAALITKRPHQPVNSLTNFQYYGHERLPSAVADAFARASAYDLMLVSRARASQIIHFYAHKHSGHWVPEESSQ